MFPAHGALPNRWAHLVRPTSALLAVALLAGACTSSEGDAEVPAPDSAVRGGALHLLSKEGSIEHLDPQRNYDNESIAFLTSTMQRTLVAYAPSAQAATANGLVADLATDLGASSDGGKTWVYTLRTGLKFEDGTPIACADVKYGVSRSFATDVISGGPTYALEYLDIPTGDDGGSAYLGPYAKTGQPDFDKAVSCSPDGRTITFRLNRAFPDFNYAVTLPAFSPVPKRADTAARYDNKPVSSGPYKIASNEVGKSLALVRNDQWDPATDPVRKAYPDTFDITFGLTSTEISKRLLADEGADQYSLPFGADLSPVSLAEVFADSKYQDRRFDGYDTYVKFWAINTDKVTDQDHRLALQAAMPRAEIRKILGGALAGELADGVIMPTMTSAYKPSQMWSSLAGKYQVPEAGDPAVAKELIAKSGKPMPRIRIDYPKTKTTQKEAEAMVEAFRMAGIKSTANPLDAGAYRSVALDPDKAGDLVSFGWVPDWMTGSTVIPPLFSKDGADISHYTDSAFQAAIAETAKMTDLTAAGEQWAGLNQQAMQAGLVIPTIFGRQQRLVGSKVAGAYLWAPYASWGYGDLSAKPQ